MEANEKAQDLFDKVDNVVCGDISSNSAQYMVELICNEIIEVLDELEHLESGQINGCYNQEYWENVKAEVKKLKL